jgi:hypothetical protein
MSHETNLSILSAKNFPWGSEVPKSYSMKNEGLTGAGTPITISAMQHLTELYYNWVKDPTSVPVEEMPAVVFFGKESLLSLLMKEGCDGVAFTFGIFDDKQSDLNAKVHLTLIAAGAKELPKDADGRERFTTAGFVKQGVATDEPFWEVVPYQNINVSDKKQNLRFDFYDYFG